ncbi:Cytochrome P450 CYP12A2 [Eumeta japonica]|uniref:Cytochrome P450 CYP12A2 n=1 Tax=Eumeta variegata TaxID=151549 RepID=A0A4C1XM90_EUMVA|nr:Cytochrome P450 CYP12A2 [Eumeta japonica]
MGLDSLEYFRKKYNKKEYDVLSERSTGLLTEQGEKWKSFRSAVNPVLMQPKIIKLYEKPIDEVAQEMVVRIRSMLNNKGMISEPFDVEMNKWALESIGVVALGGRIGCLRAELPPDAPATRLIHCVHDIFKLLHELDFRPSPWRLFTTPTFKKAMNVFQELEDLTRYFIHDAMKKLNDKKYTRTEEQKGVLEKLLEVDEDIAVKMATDMLFAGVDTTAHSMISVLYLLAVNPEKQLKLREEILSQNERKQYLKACIKEAMRVQPTAFANLRMSTKEYNLNGYIIPKGVNCLLPHEFISKQEVQYERATEFIPERWTERGEETKARAHAYATMPFGYGARMCVGRRIAELELEALLSRIIENFHVEWFGPPMKQKTITVTYMAETIITVQRNKMYTHFEVKPRDPQAEHRISIEMFGVATFAKTTINEVYPHVIATLLLCAHAPARVRAAGGPCPLRAAGACSLKSGPVFRVMIFMIILTFAGDPACVGLERSKSTDHALNHDPGLGFILDSDSSPALDLDSRYILDSILILDKRAHSLNYFIIKRSRCRLRYRSRSCLRFRF